MAILRKGVQIPKDIGYFLPENFYWICFNCHAWVGCHHNTCYPYGTLANVSLRSLRRELHQVFDNIWVNGSYSRYEAYAWLAGKLSIPVSECHIGLFNEDTCIKAMTILKKHRYLTRNYPPDSF
ncbi:TPA: hypothetical protein O7S29_003040 [Salmonella enterica]|nr:hypothetical protein [Salmonella enterica]EGT7777446.1 hypothetical protein [Salmonella enterica]EHL4430999.1 hypothetical protein [Salmonella enterica]EIZ0118195.1 hypothetical protein [Salmonella enterica]EJI2344461.1 hypothetical protein [Salmonella enterica]